MQPRHTIPVLLIALPALAQSGGDIHVSGRFISDEPTGNPPLEVQSTSQVPNLNADKLDGFDVGDFAVEGSGVGVHYKNLVGVPGSEIDQDCAVNTGCFAGDSAGFPVTISDPGSYRLASNLDVSALASAGDITVIEINSGQVTLDLAGFSIIGPVSCSNTPVDSCSSTGSGHGVLVNAGQGTVSIVNGTIRGAGSDGVRCAHACRIEALTVSENGAWGVNTNSANSASELRSVNAVRNAEFGIVAHGVLKSCRAYGNGFSGMSIGDGSTVVGATASNNGSTGINSGSGSNSIVITDSSAMNNGTHGFAMEPGSTLKNSVATGNDNNGVDCDRCLLVDNHFNGNVQAGIEFRGVGSAAGGNLIESNGSTIEFATGASAVEISTNVCDGSTSCP